MNGEPETIPLELTDDQMCDLIAVTFAVRAGMPKTGQDRMTVAHFQGLYDLKGSMLLVYHYRRAGARPMQHITYAVDDAQVNRCLARLGLVSITQPPGNPRAN